MATHRSFQIGDAIHDVAAHALLTTNVHGIASGDLVSTSATQTLTNKTLASAKIDVLYDHLGNLLADCTPGGPDPVNYFGFANANTGGPVTIEALGDDTDIGIDLVPQGAGVVTASGLPVAFQTESVVPDSTAILLATLVTDFNTLLAALRLCGITKAA